MRVAAALVLLAAAIVSPWVFWWLGHLPGRETGEAGQLPPSRVTGSAEPGPPWQLPSRRARLWSRHRWPILIGAIVGLAGGAGIGIGLALQVPPDAPRGDRVGSPESVERPAAAPIAPAPRAWPRRSP